ncbi:efflux RND transporter permease subunit [Hyphobacterium sp. HN65]|uniref:Efflux RND transporter permease subunit n=1 Tax=Hyphobacterium lacteum TaxID=3116575 RepID=A0ABU7LM10_9PROT|nr:efflux RND transporter permease subunit [Hyphobacterium sp. HN65]MEE2524973.1 efflux RND transporter permease subunit [Hyphobacterium sp. HN65]
MPLTRLSLNNPAAVFVGIALIVLMGAAALTRLPVQLFPDTDRPTVNIATFWRSASPLEMESEIVEPQEQALAGLPGLEEMRVFVSEGAAFVNLTFSVDTDMTQTAIDISNRLSQVPPLPRDAVGPNIGGFGGDAQQSLIWFFLQALPGNPHEIHEYSTFANDVIIPRLESIPGVASVNIGWGLRPQELRVTVDPFRAAELGVTLPQISAAIVNNSDVSGGNAEIGRRSYQMRFEGEFEPEELDDLVIVWREGSPVYLRDVADVDVTYGERNNFTYQNGNPAMGIEIRRQAGANVLAALDAVKAEVEEINRTLLAERDLVMAPSFDASVFIMRAINLLRTNLLIGIAMAIVGLWLFLRRPRATLIISLTIPISLLATLIVLFLFGRTLNVISLAGLAFATGMVMDAAIVVLENIIRRREMGEDPDTASEKGATQVWGALLASTATTVAIFLPLIFVSDVEGQLFADLAITIAVGVGVSMIVAVTVLPVAVKHLVRDKKDATRQRIMSLIADKVMALTDNRALRYGTIAVLLAVPVALSLVLRPPMDYLPPVKRDAVDVFFAFPPGSNLEWIETEVAATLIERLEPYMSGEREPALRNYYFGTFPGGSGATAGIRVQDQSRVRELEEIVRNEIIVGIPDVFGFAQQGDLFGGFAQGGNVQINIQSADPEARARAAQIGLQALRERFPGININANPPPQATQPRLTMIPNDRRIQEAGWARRNVAGMISMLGDGQFIGEYFDGQSRMNIILRSEGWSTPDELAGIPIVTPSGAVVPLDDLVEIREEVGIGNIQRLDRRRTITINLNQPEGQSLEEILEVVQNEVAPLIQAALPVDGTITYGGSADSLARAQMTMLSNIAMALVILFLILAGMFRSIWDAILVLVSIPLAGIGGVIMLQILNLFSDQPLDLLTMMGFFILLGLVINNAILLVDQTRQGEREGLSRRDAVDQALRMRLRPIFMSTLTSILGMLPLLLFPGVGSEIYRGLAAAIVGGMSVSLIFTLVLIPSLLRIGKARQPRPVVAAQTLPAE